MSALMRWEPFTRWSPLKELEDMEKRRQRGKQGSNCRRPVVAAGRYHGRRQGVHRQG
jgi:hypothetical protein